MISLFRSWKFWTGLLVTTTLIGLAEATQLYMGAQAMGRQIEWRRAMSATMPSWYVLALLLPFVFTLADRVRLDRGRWRRGLLVHIPASCVFAVVTLALASWLSDYVLYEGFPLSYVDNMKRLLGVYFMLDIVYYWAFVGAFYMYDYRDKYRREEQAASELALKASRLEASLARANLEALRMQLNPHFLFNTLNAVSVLALKGERQNVTRMLARLSDLLRLALENSEHVVPLAEELAFLEPYLEIEQVRFRDRLNVLQDIPPEVLDAEVPSLLLQPLVENAVRHGIARCTGPGTIEIRALTADGRLVLEVRDSGPGFTDSARDGEGHGVGLANTRARLEQLYGAEYRLELVNLPGGGAVVRVVIPFRSFQYDGAPAAGDATEESEARTA